MPRRLRRRMFQRKRRSLPRRRRTQGFGLINQARLTSRKGFARPRRSAQERTIRDIVHDSAAAWYINTAPFSVGSNNTPSGGVSMTAGLQQYGVVGLINTPSDLGQAACVPDRIPRTSLQANKKFVINNISTNLTYKNTSTAEAFLDLYWCKSRKNVAANDQAGSDPKSDIEFVFSGSTSGLFGVAAAGNVYGMTPFQSAQFIQQNQILSKTTTLLNPGSTGTIAKTLGKAQLYNTDDIGYQVTNGTTGAPVISTTLTMQQLKATYFWFAIVRGVPSGIAGATTSTQTNVDFVFTERYDVRYVVNAQTRGSNTTTLGTTAPGMQDWTNPSVTATAYGTV